MSDHMIKKKSQGTEFFQFSHLAAFPEITHGVFTRKGGVSTGCYSGLNIGSNVNDDPGNVEVNRKIILSVAGGKTLVNVHQVHGKKAVCFKAEDTPQSPFAEADAIVTDQKGAVLLVQTADCQSILIYDPVQSVVAGIHSGWKGSLQNIIGSTIDVMCKTYGSKPEDMSAGIGPSLGPCCSEFINYRLEIPEVFWGYRDDKNHFDFWRISEDQLLEKGLLRDNIQISHLCTRCNQDLFFSYRRDKVTGRLANIISII